MYKIGIIGERDSVMGFMAIGFAVHEAPDSETAAKILHQLAKDDSYAIIFMVENYAKVLNIEAQTMILMAQRQIIPAVESYITKLGKAAKVKEDI